MIRSIFICFLGLVLLIPLANAEEKPMNLLSCRSGNVSILSASKDLTVLSFEIKGIDQGIDSESII